MLVHLSIRDFAIIDALDLPLEPGLVALTGETGAGKSILLDALDLLRGGRARTDLIRAGADKAVVSAQLVLAGQWQDALLEHLEAAGLPGCDDGALVIRRVLARSGRHKQFINGALATVSQLRDIVGRFVVITGQSEEQELRAAAEQRNIVDLFGNHTKALADVARDVGRWRALRDERDALRAAAEDKLGRMDWLRFQVDEIDQLEIEPGELAQLKTEKDRLKDVEGLRAAAAEALGALEGEGGDAVGLLQRAAVAMARGSDPQLREITTVLEEAAALADDATRSLERYAEGLTADPERLAEVDDRLDALTRVSRKHGGTLETVLEAREDMVAELDAIEHSDERLNELEAELAACAERATKSCAALTRKRKASGRKLSKVIEAELGDLGMKRAKVRVEIEPLGERMPHGADRVQLWLQANPGEEGGPLGRAASGGELSRVHLAVKRALLERDPVPISVFDEVDAGVGGAIGDAVGEKLQAIAHGGRQVLCVTHLPQIAARASVHLRVEKLVEGGRTRTDVARLSAKQRKEEVARMLGGKKITARTRAHAAEMLSAGAAA
jgi:DNA repair protein RecN (Recombination protein N)